MSPNYGEIKIGAEILGLDGKAGRVRQILIVPARRQVVRLVVDRGLLRPNVVVPVEALTAANEDEVEIRLAEAELSRLPAFREQIDASEMAEDPSREAHALFIWTAVAAASGMRRGRLMSNTGPFGLCFSSSRECFTPSMARRN